MDTLVGKTLSHYLIIEQVGAGAMGVVYRARDEHLSRDVALKVLPADALADEAARKRFRKEALALSKLNHPNIATIYDFDTQEGIDFLIMEYIAGVTLDEKLSASPVPEKEVGRLGIQLAEGLAYAHREGVVHADLKPSNLRITPDGWLKILDFGLARLSRASGETGSTLSAEPVAVAGTLPYMPPELLRGEGADIRSDIYSAGAVLYEMAAGRRAFPQASAPQLLEAVLHEIPPAPSTMNRNVSQALDGIILKALDKEPERRYQSARELAVDLERLIAPSQGRVSSRARLPMPTGQKVAAGALLALLAISGVVWGIRWFAGSPRQATHPSMVVPDEVTFSAKTPSIAVLPFVNISKGEDNEYFADGLSEELLNVLANIRGLRVVSRTSAFSFKGKDVDLATVAQKLNVEMVLEGSVRKAGKRLRITAQLIQVATDSHLWSQTYDRELEDIFAVQEDIAQSVVKEVRGTLLGEKPGAAASAAVKDEVATAAKGRGGNAEAYRLYLQGRFFGARYTQGDIAKAIGYYRQALKLDPDFALAWAWLSDGYVDQAGAGWVPIVEGYGRGREAAERSLRLEPDLPEGHLALGRIRLTHDWDWKGAETSMRRALELAPGNAEVVNGAAAVASDLGRLEEAIALGRRAVALDPLSVSAHWWLAANYWYAGHLDEAEAAIRKALEISPQGSSLHYILGIVHLAQGRVNEAMTDCEREPNEVYRLHAMTLALDAKGRTADSEAVLRKYIEKYAEEGAVQIAETYAHRGEPDRAFEWLERAYRQRDPGLAEMKVDPLLRNLHADQRWQPFLEKMGLAD